MKRDLQLMKLVFVTLFVSSFSVLFSIFSSYNGNTFSRISAYAGAILFWLFLIVGYSILSTISKHRKAYERAHRDKGARPVRSKSKPGILCFFSNRYAIIADIVMILAFVITMVFMFIPNLDQNVAVVFVAVLIYSVHMHSILNGVNFRYINSLIYKGE